MSNKVYSLSDQEFKDIVKSSHNIKEILSKLKLTTIGNSWAYSLVQRRMRELGLSNTDLIGESIQVNYVPSNKKSNKDIFTENSSYPRSALRRKIIKESLLEYKCSNPECGISEWKGHPISLELDHINGINNDNRLSNLRFLCPNCHSQTVTYGSKNLNNISRVSTDEDITEDTKQLIIDKYKELNSINKVRKDTKIKKSIIIKVISSTIGLRGSNQKYVIRYNLQGEEIARYKSINEACQALIDNKELRTKLVKTARNTFLRNYNRVWLNSSWKVVSMDYGK